MLWDLAVDRMSLKKRALRIPATSLQFPHFLEDCKCTSASYRGKSDFGFVSIERD